MGQTSNASLTRNMLTFKKNGDMMMMISGDIFSSWITRPCKRCATRLASCNTSSTTSRLARFSPASEKMRTRLGTNSDLFLG